MGSIVHIGSDKTGTTAIQQALAQNRDTLMANGFVYPDVDGRPDHRGLLTNPGLLRVDSPDHTMILSFEGFWPAGPERLERLLSSLPKPLIVLGWARSPQNYVEAAFRQQCKKAVSVRQLRTLLRVANLPPPINPVGRRAVRRFEQMIPWKEQFGDSLCVANYESQASDIVAAFAVAAGISGLKSPHGRPNASPSITALFALALLREHHADVDAFQFLDATAALGETSTGFITSRRVRRWCWEQAQRPCSAVGLRHVWDDGELESTPALLTGAENLLEKVRNGGMVPGLTRE